MLAVTYKVKLHGRCSKPLDLAGRNLADIMNHQPQQLNAVKNSRLKRSTFNQSTFNEPSIYNFTGNYCHSQRNFINIQKANAFIQFYHIKFQNIKAVAKFYIFLAYHRHQF